MRLGDNISPALFSRLQKHAEPLIDDLESVLTRLLDFYEQHTKSSRATNEVDDIRLFSPNAPPSLTHTRILSANFAGETVSSSGLTWNALLHEAIRVAVKKTKLRQDLKHIILVNFVFGKKESDGYRYLPECDLSVQGQDANNAWKGTYHIAKRFEITFDVVFTWRMRDDAAHPGVIGRFAHRTRLHYVEA